jgi:hypothetical protein
LSSRPDEDLSHFPEWLLYTSPFGQLGVLAPLPLLPPLTAKAEAALNEPTMTKVPILRKVGKNNNRDRM